MRLSVFSVCSRVSNVIFFMFFAFFLFVFAMQDVLRDNLEPAMELLADTLVNPRVTAVEVEEQKAVSSDTKRSKDGGSLSTPFC